MKSLRSLLILGVAAAWLATTGPAHASPMPPPSTSTYAAIYFPISNPLCAPACVFDPHFSHVSDGKRLAEASADYGSVGAELTIHEDMFEGQPQFLEESQGSMLDYITFGGQTGTGSIRFDVDLHGSASTTLPGIVDPSIIFFFQAGNVAGNVSRIDVNSVVDGFPSKTFTSPALAFTFGDPIRINMGLFAAMLQHADGDHSPLIASVLYRKTAAITGLTVLDAQGSPITNYSITSESGANYSFVPEPSSAWLLGTGVLVLLHKRRSCSRAARTG